MAEELYDEGSIVSNDKGDQLRLTNGEWVPVSKPTTVLQDVGNIANKALSSVGTLAEGVAGFPAQVMRTGATLSSGASDLLQGNLPDWQRAREQFAPGNNPVLDTIDQYTGKAIKGAVSDLGGDTGTSYLAEGVKAIVDPLAQAVGPLSDASKTSLDVLGVGAGLYAPKVLTPVGMSSMAKRVVEQGAELGAKVDPVLQRYAPRYTGVNQTIEAGLDDISKVAGKAVGLTDDAPLTAKTLNIARADTKSTFNDLLTDAPAIPRAEFAGYLQKSVNDAELSVIQKAEANNILKNYLPTGSEAGDLTAKQLMNMQSRIRKDAQLAVREQDFNKANTFDAVHDGVMDALQSRMSPDKLDIFTTARAQYRAQALLNRNGIIGQEGRLNTSTLYNQIKNQNIDVEKNPKLANLAALKERVITAKDLGGVRTNKGIAESVVAKGLAIGAGAWFGGPAGAAMGYAAGMLEPAVAALSSRVYPKAIAGMSSMASRMRQFDSTQPSNTWLSPNAGKFGQGGGIGVSATRQAALAARAERAAAANRPVGRPANAPRPEDLGVPPALNRMTKPQQKHMLDWIDKNPKTFQGLASKGETPYRDVYDLPEGARVQPQPDMLPDPRTIATRGTEDMDVFSSGLLSPQPAMEIPLEQLAAIRQQAKDVAHLSNWDKAKVKEQTRLADEMLARDNPRDIATKQYKEQKQKKK